MKKNLVKRVIGKADEVLFTGTMEECLAESEKFSVGDKNNLFIVTAEEVKEETKSTPSGEEGKEATAKTVEEVAAEDGSKKAEEVKADEDPEAKKVVRTFRFVSTVEIRKDGSAIVKASHQMEQETARTKEVEFTETELKGLEKAIEFLFDEGQ